MHEEIVSETLITMRATLPRVCVIPASAEVQNRDIDMRRFWLPASDAWTNTYTIRLCASSAGSVVSTPISLAIATPVPPAVLLRSSQVLPPTIFVDR